ncbi:MAG: tetratricopeptide repeat protein [Candidatus Zixiibacteriota bacterium]
MSGLKSLSKILFAFLLIIGIACSSDSSKGIIFNAEKLYQKAAKLIENASIKPEIQQGPYTEEIKAAFINLNDYWLTNIDSLPKNKYPDERQNLVSIGFLSIGQLSRIYYEEKKYDSAIYIISQFLTKAEPEGSFLLSAKLNLARIYQASGNFETAMAIYNGLIDTFYPPVNNQGTILNEVLNLPIAVVRIYSLLKNEKLKTDATLSAENYYNRLLTEWPNSSLATAAHSNLAKIYYDEKKWDKSIANLKEMTDSTGNTDIESLMMIATITADGKKDYKKAIELYGNILKKVDDTLKTPSVLLRLAITHYDSKNYKKAEEYINQIKNQYGYFYRINPLPQNYFALALKDQGQWSRAESEFQFLIDNYPASEAAFDAFITIADHYQTDKNKAMAERWRRRAEEFYLNIGSRYAGTSIEASSLSYMAEIARLENRWLDAVKYLENIFNKFPQSDIGRKSIITAAGIYKERLNNENKANSLLNRLKAELFPVSDGKKNDIITDDKL